MLSTQTAAAIVVKLAVTVDIGEPFKDISFQLYIALSRHGHKFSVVNKAVTSSPGLGASRRKVLRVAYRTARFRILPLSHIE